MNVVATHKKSIKSSVVGLLHFNCAPASNQIPRWRRMETTKGERGSYFLLGATSIIPESYHKLAYVLENAVRKRGQILYTIIYG